MIESTAASPSTLPTAAAPLIATSSIASIQVAIDSLSQSLQNISHAIQTNAIPVAVPNGDSLTLATALGDITVTLPALTAAARQDMLQQLLNLTQTQRPLTLSIQPGSPPTQAVLLIPTAGVATPPAAQAASGQNTLQITPALSSLPLITKGDALPALVLPQAVTTPMPLSAATGQTYAQPAALFVPTADNSENPAQAAPSLAPRAPSVVAPAEPQSTTAIQDEIAQKADSHPGMSGNAAPDAPDALAALARQPAIPALMPAVAASPAPVFTNAITPSSPMALLQSGVEVVLHVDDVVPPTAAAVPTLAATQIIATVTDATPDGKPLVQIGNATLFVKAQITAPVGTRLVVTVEAARTPPLTLLPAPSLPDLQALSQAAAVLAQTDPQALQQMLALHMPQPTAATLPGALLLLFGAFKQADARSLLGDSATDSLLQTGHNAIVDSLSRDLGNAGQTTQDAVVGDWRSYPIPLYAQQQFQALTLYVHKDGTPRQGGADKAAADKKLRFVIDLRLSRLGAMQLDGFVQPKRLDMVLRSEAVLPAGMHNDLRLSYIKAMEAVGYTGSLNFQVGRQHWLTMQRAAPRGIVT